jgi:prepilin-type N-terminal cleavage/methylation domain-containing protein
MTPDRANTFEFRRREDRAGTGFTLIELLVVIVIIALLIAIVLPGLGKARKSARTAHCEANLRMFSTGFQNYTGDAKGLIASFSWQPNVMTPSDYTDNLIVPNGALQANARQAIDILRRINHDPTLFTGNPSVNAADGIFVARNFTQLVLMDGGYYGDRYPEPSCACSEDRNLIQWQKLTPQQAQATLYAYPIGAPAAFAPFFSSYQIVPAAFQDEKGPGQIYHVSYDYRYFYWSYETRLRPRPMDKVMFPAQKVVWFDMFDRHFYKRDIWFAYKEAKQPLAFFDGSVSVRATRDANLGWQNEAGQQFANPQPSMVTYAPAGYSDPPALNSIAQPQYYRWTRGGLRGVDFIGSEVKK